MSYQGLARAADAVAVRLRAQGVLPGTRVAVVARRSLELPAALLGILKAGAAYVPLDPSWPEERLRFLKADSELRHLVVHGRSDTSGATVQAVFPDDAVIDATAAELPERESHLPPPSDAQVACVLYTSGSTGSPKGVEVLHSSIIRLVVGQEYVCLGPDVVMLHLSPLAFDASSFEIWGALLNGGRLVVHPDGPLSHDRLRSIIAAHAVNTMFLTTRLFDRFVLSRPPEPNPLRQVVIGGEAAAIASVERFYRICPATDLVNGYGPTETTTFALCYRVPRDVRFERSIPIGQPIRGATVRVLDDTDRPVASGEPGELWIGGAGLAKGYLGRPELTARAFVVDANGERWYRTGDLVRRLPDGNFDFLGRRDRQVKVRGHRVEPGEVEQALARVPGVQACAVLASSDEKGDTRLIAYVVLADAFEGTFPDGLREPLLRMLPAYAIPAFFVRLQELPLNANGKIDTTALPAPPSLRGESSPAGSGKGLEGIVWQAWREALELDEIDPGRDFAAHGGDSLRLMTLALLLEKRLGSPVDLAAAGSPLTIDAVCAAIRKPIDDAGSSCSIDLAAPGDTLLICFTGGGGGLMMPPFDFIMSIQALEAKKILLRDNRRAFYHLGLEGVSADIASTVGFLREQMGTARARRVITLGTSMGGYAALLFGLLVAADEVHAFAPITRLGPELPGYDAPGLVSWREMMPRLDKDYFDLASHYRDAARAPRVFLYAGERNSTDAAQVEHMRGLPGVHIEYQPTDDHNVARFMMEQGSLARLLAR